MKFKIGKIEINIEALFIIFTISILSFSTIRGYFDGYITCFLFVVFHEFSHVFVASILGIECIKINIRLCGMNAVLKASNTLSAKWLYVYFAGPVSNLMLAVVFNSTPIIRDVNVALACINLLPISPLDGFKILNILFNWCLSKLKARKILNSLQWLTICALFIFGVYVFLKFRNPSALIFGVYVILLRGSKTQQD